MVRYILLWDKHVRTTYSTMLVLREPITTLYNFTFQWDLVSREPRANVLFFLIEFDWLKNQN